MLISICVPTYNGEKYLKRALNSCVNQLDYDEEYEVLILNNASIDNTECIIDEFVSSYSFVRCIKNEKTVTQFENHNLCLENAKGKYVIFCHTDDELTPYALKNIKAKLVERNFLPRYILWGRSMFNDYYSMLDRVNKSLNEIMSGGDVYKLFIGNGLAPSGTCYSRKAMLEEGGFLDCHLIPPHSDSLTMLFLSLNNFSFEMMDDVIIQRSFASTKHKVVNNQDRLYMNSFLRRYFTKTQLNNILKFAIKNREYEIAEYITLDYKFNRAKIIMALLMSTKWENIRNKRVLRVLRNCFR